MVFGANAAFEKSFKSLSFVALAQRIAEWRPWRRIMDNLRAMQLVPLAVSEDCRIFRNVIGEPSDSNCSSYFLPFAVVAVQEMLEIGVFVRRRSMSGISRTGAGLVALILIPVLARAPESRHESRRFGGVCHLQACQQVDVTGASGRGRLALASISEVI